MGTFTVRARLPNGQKVEALVDTGATFSKLPSRLLRGIGVHPDFTTTVELGDGSRLRRQVGYVRLALAGKRALVPVMFGGQREQALIGATTLEILGLAPDPVRKSLTESPHLEVSERRSR